MLPINPLHVSPLNAVYRSFINTLQQAYELRTDIAPIEALRIEIKYISQLMKVSTDPSIIHYYGLILDHFQKIADQNPSSWKEVGERSAPTALATTKRILEAESLPSLRVVADDFQPCKLKAL